MSFTEEDRDRWVAALGSTDLPTLPDELGRTIVAALDEAVDHPPIPALLPRDWPRQLYELCDNLSAPLTARQAAFALVDQWVLAADAASTPDTA